MRKQNKVANKDTDKGLLNLLQPQMSWVIFLTIASILFSQRLLPLSSSIHTCIRKCFVIICYHLFTNVNYEIALLSYDFLWLRSWKTLRTCSLTADQYKTNLQPDPFWRKNRRIDQFSFLFFCASVSFSPKTARPRFVNLNCNMMEQIRGGQFNFWGEEAD